MKAPPLYSVEAGTLYHAGVQHGKLASARIRAWLVSEEIIQLINFTRGSGKAQFEQLKNNNARAFPQYVQEMRGIADGAGVDLDMIWALNLIMELEALMPTGKYAGHCSDFYSMHAPSTTDGFGHAHNEDWGSPANEYYYYVKYTALPGADFSSCAGLSYPGVLIGWAPTWNEYGIYSTQNTLWPLRPTSGGLGTAFAQREAICGPSGGKGLDAVVKSLTSGNWADGASVNLVDLKERRQVNVERATDSHNVLEITAAMSNYSHFNVYKQSVDHTDQFHAISSIHRQARANVLPAPLAIADLKSLLSDIGDAAYPIFRKYTLASLVLDGSGRLDVWCCGGAPSRTKPCYSWNVLHFFDRERMVV